MGGAETIAVGAEDAGLRLDRWFKRRYPALNHARLSKLLRTGQVRLDGARVKAGVRLEPGQRIRVPPLRLSASPAPPPRPLDPATAADLRARVLYRDDWLIALDKPPGLAVQGGTKTVRHLDAMLDALTYGASERPRLVHRLDKDTSGVLVLGRTARAAAALTAAFRRKEIHKLYWALVVGVPKPRAGRIALSLAKREGRGGGERVVADDSGRAALTEYRVIEAAGRRLGWLELTPRTGRTHQLRAHCAALGTPILGDRKYGGAGAFLPATLPRRACTSTPARSSFPGPMAPAACASSRPCPGTCARPGAASASIPAAIGDRRSMLAAPAVGRDALVGKPKPLGRRAALIEDVDRDAAAGVPVAADPEPLGRDLGDQTLGDGHRAVLMKSAVVAEGAEI